MIVEDDLKFAPTSVLDVRTSAHVNFNGIGVPSGRITGTPGSTVSWLAGNSLSGDLEVSIVTVIATVELNLWKSVLTCAGGAVLNVPIRKATKGGTLNVINCTIYAPVLSGIVGPTESLRIVAGDSSLQFSGITGWTGAIEYSGDVSLGGASVAGSNAVLRGSGKLTASIQLSDASTLALSDLQLSSRSDLQITGSGSAATINTSLIFLENQSNVTLMGVVTSSLSVTGTGGSLTLYDCTIDDGFNVTSFSGVFNSRNQLTIKPTKPAGLTLPIPLSFSGTLSIDGGNSKAPVLLSNLSTLEPGAAIVIINSTLTIDAGDLQGQIITDSRLTLNHSSVAIGATLSVQNPTETSLLSANIFVAGSLVLKNINLDGETRISGGGVLQLIDGVMVPGSVLLGVNSIGMLHLSLCCRIQLIVSLFDLFVSWSGAVEKTYDRRNVEFDHSSVDFMGWYTRRARYPTDYIQRWIDCQSRCESHLNHSSQHDRSTRG